ncbi:MAG: hypothetical protein ACHQLQ_04170 [Candidatus Acidiferrales bacterium]
MRGNYPGKAQVVAGAIGVALLCAAFGATGKPDSAANRGKYDVVIANGRAGRAPIS